MKQIDNSYNSNCVITDFGVISEELNIIIRNTTLWSLSYGLFAKRCFIKSMMSNYTVTSINRTLIITDNYDSTY